MAGKLTKAQAKFKEDVFKRRMKHAVRTPRPKRTVVKKPKKK
jgi:hypothetical protein